MMINRRRFLGGTLAASAAGALPLASLAKTGAGEAPLPIAVKTPDMFFTKFNIYPGQLPLFSVPPDHMGRVPCSLFVGQTSAGAWTYNTFFADQFYLSSWDLHGTGHSSQQAEDDCFEQLRGVMGRALIRAGTSWGATTEGSLIPHRPMTRAQAKFTVDEMLRVLRPVPERKVEFFEHDGFMIGIDVSDPEVFLWMDRGSGGWCMTGPSRSSYDYFGDYGLAILNTRFVAAQRLLVDESDFVDESMRIVNRCNKFTMAKHA
jgi:hypothetical protein